MFVIRQQGIKKIFKTHMKGQKADEEKLLGREVSMAEIKEKMIANALPIDLSSAD